VVVLDHLLLDPKAIRSLRRYVSTKKPRSSANALGCSSLGPSRRVSMISKASARKGNGDGLVPTHR